MPNNCRKSGLFRPNCLRFGIGCPCAVVGRTAAGMLRSAVVMFHTEPTSTKAEGLRPRLRSDEGGRELDFDPAHVIGAAAQRVTERNVPSLLEFGRADHRGVQRADRCRECRSRASADRRSGRSAESDPGPQFGLLQRVDIAALGCDGQNEACRQPKYFVASRRLRIYFTSPPSPAKSWPRITRWPRVARMPFVSS